MSTKGWILLLGLAGVITVVLVETRRTVSREASGEQPTIADATLPVKYEEGVFYFPATGEAYRFMLARFLEDHADLSCKYFGADDKVDNPGMTSAHAYTVGHTLVCRPRVTYAQDEVLP